jgi:hypothetical protein
MVQHGESWVLTLVFFWANGAFAESGYPDLRNAHDPELQKAKDKALGPSHPEFWDGVHKKEFSVVIADVTDLHHPQVAWYNPDLMLYAASLPKIAIVLGVFVEIERGVIKLDSETRNQLIRMIRHSSNRDATVLLLKVGYERLAHSCRTSATANFMIRPTEADSGSEKLTVRRLPGDAIFCTVYPTAPRLCRRPVFITD